jgi:hypothetical protein
LSPLTHCITGSPPLRPTPSFWYSPLSLSHWYPLAHFIGTFWSLPYECNWFIFISSETENSDTCVVLTFYRILFFIVILIHRLKKFLSILSSFYSFFR